MAMKQSVYIVNPEDRILITGANGFIGARVVGNLLDRGFRNLRLFTRPSSSIEQLSSLLALHGRPPSVEIIRGNLLSREDCARATSEAAVILHLAAGRGEKSFPDAFMNSVVSTRNVLDATLTNRGLKRFVNVSSFAVYTNESKPSRVLDES